jgi:RNA polymerase sigma factor (sigma-70 family)
MEALTCGLPLSFPEDEFMADGQLRSAMQHLRRLMGRPNSSALSDAQLLDNFVNRGDEASFEVLVWRHGTLVLSLCRRILRDSHEAEDAFQAVFLILARKAASIGKRQAVASWLYKVAFRVALRARSRLSHKHRSLNDPDSLPCAEAGDDALWRDLLPALDEEIHRLPEKYRVPFVLCHLQGQTNEEAADQLGCPKGTILSRLSRGRERLRARLSRRGITLTAVGLTAVLTQNASSAAVPATLVGSTIDAAIPFASGTTAAGAVSSSITTLAEGVLRTMYLTKLKLATAALMALAILGGGAGWVTHRALADNSRSGGSSSGDRAERPGQPRERGSASGDDAKSERISGKVTDVAKDGKSFAIETPGATREDSSIKRQVTIGDKTVVNYSAVGTDGATPTAGYTAQVMLVEPGKDIAATINFQGAAGGYGRGGRTDVSGKVAAVARDGKGITVEIPSANPRTEDPKRIDLTFNNKTVLVFSNVAKGGASLAEGLHAQVVLEDPTGTVAAIVSLKGAAREDVGRGEERRDADIAGKVVAVGKDEKSITVEVPPARGTGREERPTEPVEPKKVDIKLNDNTSIAFYSVNSDETKVVEGMTVRIWLASGSKDTAATANFNGTPRQRWATHAGKITAVSKDGKTITVEIPPPPPKERGEEPKSPTKMEFVISSKTHVCYNGVGTGEAKPTEGFMANVSVDEGANEAFEVFFSKGGSRGR